MNNNNGDQKRLSRDDEDDEDEDDYGNGRGLDAWERTYADERSWESLQEDESGLLRPIDNKTLYHAQYRRRLRTASTVRIQKGLIRYLFIVIDLSKVIYRFVSVSVELFDSVLKRSFGFAILRESIGLCVCVV